MRVFILGGTGHVGSAVIDACRARGWAVTAGVRSEEGKLRAEGMGAKAVLVTATEPSSFIDVAAEHDILVNAICYRKPVVQDASQPGAKHGADFLADPKIELDSRSTEGLLEAAKKRDGKTVVLYTSGHWVLGPGARADEDAPTNPLPQIRYRVAIENAVKEANSERVYASLVRFGFVTGSSRLPWVHQNRDGVGFTSAVRHKAVEYFGDGSYHVPLVYREDLASLYPLIVEKGGRGVFHAVYDSVVTAKELAAICAKTCGLEPTATKSVPIEALKRSVGDMAEMLTQDQIVISKRSKALGWAPKHPDFAAHAPALHEEWLTWRRIAADAGIVPFDTPEYWAPRDAEAAAAAH